MTVETTRLVCVSEGESYGTRKCAIAIVLKPLIVFKLILFICWKLSSLFKDYTRHPSGKTYLVSAYSSKQHRSLESTFVSPAKFDCSQYELHIPNTGRFRSGSESATHLEV